MDPEACAIIVSYSGETPILVRVMKVLKAKSIPVIVITNIGENSLTKEADCILRITTREKLYSKIATFSTDMSITYLLDVLYSCVFALNYEQNVKTKTAISRAIETGRVSSLDILKEDDDDDDDEFQKTPY